VRARDAALEEAERLMGELKMGGWVLVGAWVGKEVNISYMNESCLIYE